VALPDGTVAAIARTPEDAADIHRSDRQMVVYTLDEIGVMLSHYRAVTQAKEFFAGAVVEQIRRTINDPLDGFRDGRRLEDTLSDQIPHLGA
jgi:hypothetical protein